MEALAAMEGRALDACRAAPAWPWRATRPVRMRRWVSMRTNRAGGIRVDAVAVARANRPNPPARTFTAWNPGRRAARGWSVTDGTHPGRATRRNHLHVAG